MPPGRHISAKPPRPPKPETPEPCPLEPLALGAHPVAADIDRPGIARPKRLDAEPGAFDRLGAEARQENIRRFDEAQKDFAARLRLQIERDALLAAIVLLHGEV